MNQRVYGEDLRWRIVWQSCALRLSNKTIASNLSIDESTVQRIVRLFDTTGTVSKKPYPAENAFRKITETVQLFICNLILQQPGVFLREITNEVSNTLGVDVSESAVFKFLGKSGFTRQKLATYAMQRDDHLRMQFAHDVSLYSKQSLIFIDETGSDNRDAIRKYGYSLRGKPIKAQKLLVRGKHVSAIAAMSVEGIVAIKLVHGGVDGDDFYDFITHMIFPKLMPFDGSNQNSIIIMDNCSIHHVDQVQQVFTDAQVLTHYLPPYSPDYNPIEMAFSKVKYVMKAMEKDMQMINDIDIIVLAAFAAITKEDCQAWINKVDIYK